MPIQGANRSHGGCRQHPVRKRQAEVTAGPVPKQQSPAELLARRGLVFLGGWGLAHLMGASGNPNGSGAWFQASDG